MDIGRREKLLELLKDKEYRDAFVSEHIDTGLPFQIKALREQREWSQEKLGQEAGMHQERISTLEDPNYAKFTLKTLKRLASAFDVALMAVFVPFSKLLNWESDLSPEALQAVSFANDNFSLEKQVEKEKERVVEETIHDKINPSKTLQAYPQRMRGLIFDPTRSGAFASANEFFGAQIPQESELIKIMRNANETSLNPSGAINLARAVS
jgi:transcriptional regulator with XRE-family HTH domain